MPVTIKVLPVTDDDVGLVHPLDGPLTAEGSDWTHDAWTERRIQKQKIRRFESEPQADAKPAKVKPQAAA